MESVTQVINGANNKSTAMELSSFVFDTKCRSSGAVIPYGEWFKTRILRHRAFVWVLAAYLHWVLLLALTMIAVHLPEAMEELKLTVGFAEFTEDTEPIELLAPMPLPEPPAAAELMSESSAIQTIDELNRQLLPANPLAEDVSEEQIFPEAVRAMAVEEASAVNSGTAQREGDRVEESKGRGPNSEMSRMPYHAITAGSFSVWTIPANPKRWQPYVIIVQIRVPEDLNEYPLTDLEGLVVGSDGYQKRIPGSIRGVLPVSDGTVRLEIPVVSADANVQDIVFVKSRMLAEAQRLTIQF